MMLVQYILLIPLLLFSLSFHEYAHGKTADLLGDPTPKMQGRLTLNPMAHLSLLGTLVLLITRRFGWAKPVQVNPRNFSNQKQGMMLVGLAGPTANVLIAVILGITFNLFGGLLTKLIKPEIVVIFFGLGVAINLGLAIFNLIPVPPLDGSEIMEGLIPKGNEKIIRNLEAYGPFFLLLFVFMGWIRFVINPIFALLARIPIFNVLQYFI
ncbi:site-2 protease family protein [Halanaerobacter jeridensis]|uniref:Zn-dependent protease n=1 Tax=Halanaerobacter jeridensis TaxID=706427 RepID=A0A938XQ09_9FIRM|nr:site-2 protease family protein [Halanaerobacter jeridensis]MBM7555301.1 Zn-dependent protease [Halanaerobacter jeridensis]